MNRVTQKSEQGFYFPLLHILVFALVLRVIGILLTLQVSGASFAEYLDIHDGRDYIAFARALDSGSLKDARQWVVVRFPGFPFAVYVFGLILGKAWGMAALVLNIGGALLAIFFFDRIFRNRKATLYFSIFTPSWFLFSSINATEGFFLFLNLLGLYLIWNKNKHALGYLVLGLSALVRPFGVFVIAALIIWGLVRKKKSEYFIYALISGLPMLCWLCFCRIYYGSFFHNVSQYSDIWEHRMLGLPFKALLVNSIRNPRILKLCLVWGTVIFSIMATVFSGRYLLKNPVSEKWGVVFLWQFFSCMFYFSLSSSNPFISLDRYILTALPAQLISVSGIFPKRRFFFFVAAVLTLFIFLYWNRNHFIRLAA